MARARGGAEGVRRGVPTTKTLGVAIADATGALHSNLLSGSGAPAAGIGKNGDVYLRDDTPAIATQRIYVKSAGSWTGVV